MIILSIRRSSLCIILFTCNSLLSFSQKINRKALVQRHNVIVTKADSLSSLTVGNGRFAFTVDATGLQTFPKEYSKGVPLGTQSEWGWNSFNDTAGYKREEAYKNFHVNGRDVPYTVQWNSPERNKNAANWFRQNPHRLQLANIGFELVKKDGTAAKLEDIKDIKQELDLWTGEIKSRFVFDGEPVTVSTVCDNRDIISFHVQSPLLADCRLMIRLRFPYPTGQWTDEGANFSNDDLHRSRSIIPREPSTTEIIMHDLQNSATYVTCTSSGFGNVSEKQNHYFLFGPPVGATSFWMSIAIGQNPTKRNPPYTTIKQNSLLRWQKFWNSGGAIDFSGSTDDRAFELERRIILSQYLMRAQEAGEFPPQETGLTYNSWFGKPHLEMHWWHATHWALWGRTELLERNMNWYKTVAPKAREIAKRQGFDGIRWQKMTDNTGDETPSSIGALLLWQQPHYIYFAELIYRNRNHDSVLKKYKDLVFATADFMSSFPYLDPTKQKFILGKGMIPAQERFKAEETFNPPFEMVYWHWALQTAQQWKKRLGLPREKKWDDLLAKFAPLPVQDDKYLFAESATDSYTNPEYRTDHPAVLGAFGMLPGMKQVDDRIMRNTFDWIWNNWNWKETWGWDFPLTAMTTIRMGLREKTIEALLMNIPTNRYLVNGHNYQDERLRLYMPGNGGLLAAAAMMCAGYDGCTEKNPGIPTDGKWKVRWEGLRKMP